MHICELLLVEVVRIFYMEGGKATKSQTSVMSVKHNELASEALIRFETEGMQTTELRNEHPHLKIKLNTHQPFKVAPNAPTQRASLKES